MEKKDVIITETIKEVESMLFKEAEQIALLGGNIRLETTPRIGLICFTKNKLEGTPNPAEYLKTHMIPISATIRNKLHEHSIYKDEILDELSKMLVKLNKYLDEEFIKRGHKHVQIK
ncbi:MAG: hypothetical protein SOY68_03750 [Fusobacterium varium]|uniref:hypothetical protein n=1 Tax=Fusobacterium varium TaxID=856 RepID=UPI002432488F|nr:hypothetical protein [Fusobacterium varium]MCI6033677.1 hypothetical protein [Fusobacterium varium]MDY4005006.1 hypothetical protein [Fusobacterium varium]